MTQDELAMALWLGIAGTAAIIYAIGMVGRLIGNRRRAMRRNAAQ